MKKIVPVLLFISCCSFVAKAQSKFGIQLGYGTEIEKPSLGANAEIFLGEKVSLTPSVAFYLPIKENVGGGEEIKINFWELNGDLHFYLSMKDDVGIYALAGINYMNVKVKFPSSFGFSDESDSETGANLGIGFNFSGSGSNPFLEFKYETVGEGQVVLTAGIRF